jgi:hypothetical protein
MEELHTDSIDGGHEASYGDRSRARERAYSNKGIPIQGFLTMTMRGSKAVYHFTLEQFTQPLEAVARLLLARADIEVNSKDSIDWTPLSWDAENGHEAVVKLLQSHDS